MTRVLVTGGAGYIGSHTCKMLRQEGFEPIVFDNLSIGHRELVKWGSLVEGDILDKAAVANVLKTWEPKAVIHFAGSAYVGESVLDPAKYYRNNVAGSLTLAQSMVDAKIDKLVFSSSCATYGIPQSVPIAEDSQQQPINPYGRTKLIVEHMLNDFDRAYALRSTCLRYFNACGADPDGDIGEIHDPEPHLIPRAILAALGEIKDFEIHGSDYPTPDGSPVRDYIHVCDLAAGHVAAVKRLLDGAPSEKFNLGVGRGYSVKEVIAEIERVIERPVPHTVGPRRAGDPPSLIADSSLAKKMLEFRPRWSNLQTIVDTAWRWHSRRHKRKQDVEPANILGG
jgi:UDP-arabinose 4-epimerase